MTCLTWVMIFASGHYFAFFLMSALGLVQVIFWIKRTWDNVNEFYLVENEIKLTEVLKKIQ